MNRIEVINKIIQKIHGNTYLEIGVQAGKTISKVSCRRKIAVDPAFIFRFSMKIKLFLGIQSFERYQMTSDDFFMTQAGSVLLHGGLDVVLVDGLHTYQQAKQDIENSLKYLNSGGAIVVHDCNPLNAAAAYPIQTHFDEIRAKVDDWDLPGWQGQWNGEVWKAIAHLIVSRRDLNIFTLDMDFGLCIITRGKQQLTHQISLDEIIKADFAFFEANRSALINLRHPRYFFEFLNEN